MELRGLALFTLAVIAAAVASSDPPPAPITANLCAPDTKICNCVGPAIECLCKNDEKLEVAEGSIDTKTEATSFQVTNCSSLIFNADNLKNAASVTTLILKDIANVNIHKALTNLETLTVENVRDLKFDKNVLAGANALHSISITHSTIPKLSQELKFSPGKRILEFNNVTINNVEKSAFQAEGLSDGSSVRISNCTIENIEEGGLKITSPSIILKNSLIKNAKENSVELNGQTSLEIEGSTLYSGVNVNSIKFERSSKIKLTNNTLRNIEISKLKEKETEEPFSYIVDVLVTSDNDNYVNCSCGIYPKLNEQMSKNIFCISNCKKATLKSVIDKCREEGVAKPTDIKQILGKICDAFDPRNIMPSTPNYDQNKGATEGPTGKPEGSEDPEKSTVKPVKNETHHIEGQQTDPKSHASKNSVYFLPVLIVYFSHLLQ